MSKLFLLSKEEALKIPQDILACDNCWWLRSPSSISYYAMYVTHNGYVYRGGDYVFNVSFAVRPALLLSSPLSELNLERSKKGYVKLGRKVNGKPIKWIDISEYIGRPCLLMKKPYEHYIFDGMSNVYETSVIKTRLAELDDILCLTDIYKDIVFDWSDYE